MPPPGGLPNSGIEPTFFMCPAVAGGFSTTSTTWEAQLDAYSVCNWVQVTVDTENWV